MVGACRVAVANVDNPNGCEGLVSTTSSPRIDSSAISAERERVTCNLHMREVLSGRLTSLRAFMVSLFAYLCIGMPEGGSDKREFIDHIASRTSVVLQDLYTAAGRDAAPPALTERAEDAQGDSAKLSSPVSATPAKSSAPSAPSTSATPAASAPSSSHSSPSHVLAFATGLAFGSLAPVNARLACAGACLHPCTSRAVSTPLAVGTFLSLSIAHHAHPPAVCALSLFEGLLLVDALCAWECLNALLVTVRRWRGHHTPS